ncbi:Aminopeptidase N [Lentilactobacillus parabuchneri]|jgi:aminopeptidase N|uniref:Aminopeptidase n=5 Tax=Lentilactobacillus parabuchneri TaxID=152331 RepID=A0A1X1FDU8_9LACO|nr:M1 family metallopeptidase [Lentilactobacillus parabuchneri]APR07800.1 Aminopeptidase N [Lentilactobacillus parabuchneri]KRM47042.1 membrane alanyl aminopeptidase [Lentilactobacillus parabuchneri DSM 5707 = NBRC 107865]KRN70803.1 membrane alanyl aminopeptidase [Lentilactobacillus parabuchneri]MBW0222230.1 M1 family metallopeptidase [Lentilactobacillus parabuchneri]MBW0245533.1 M1 family metallopeptidase [Lentilactobacillus parabuchneri]
MAEQLTHFYEKFQPTHYNIYLDINRQDKQFSGTSTITGDAKEQSISIHQKFLDIQSVQLDGQDLSFTRDDKQEAIHINLPKTGEVKLVIAFQAKLTDTMMGIYPSYYEVDGVKKQIIGTQFETTAARQAFPCVDEPEAKATFDLAIKFDEHEGESIISNMPEIRTENGVHYFDTTMRMSTYLIAFGFGELQSVKTTTKSGVEVGVFSTKAHQQSELDFALDIAKRSIEFYEDFYQTPYPLPHSWQLALPDFSAGAMENWGLVTYREAYLLLDPENTSFEMKQLVATVIAHELAHQWFGDLVTMKWWDDLWLNESFANMMEYVAIDAIEPNWHIWEVFQTSEAPAALQRDATDGVQSVHVQVEDPAEIDSIFDSAIVYAKGARMLVMARALVGDGALRKGLKAYFDAHKFHNATGADLWSALGDASGMDVGAIMNSWLEQPGYPVVTAKVVDGQLTLSQQQFFIGKGHDVDRKWQIPLNSNYEAVPEIMADQSLTIGDYAELRNKTGKPFFLNVGNSSHFIVQYDETLMKDILDHVASLDSISQLQLLQDLRLLADGRKNSYANIVPLLPTFSESQSNIVNAALYRVASNLQKFVTPKSVEETALKAFFDKLSASQLAHLGWQPKAGESNDDQLTRPYILSAALYAENADAIASAHTLFNQNKENLAGLSADIRVFVLKNEVKNFGSDALFDQLLADYRKTADASYKQDICAALTSTTDASLIAKLVSKFEDADTIKPQDLRAWFRGVLANNDGQQAAWDWIRNDWQWLEDTVGGDMEFATYITVIAGIFHTQQRLDEFKAFFEPKIPTPGLTREIKMDISVIDSRVSLVQDEKADVNAAISQVIK